MSRTHSAGKRTAKQPEPDDFPAFDADELDPDEIKGLKDPAKVAALARLSHVIAQGDLPGGIVILQPWSGSWTPLFAEVWKALARANQPPHDGHPDQSDVAKRKGFLLVIDREPGSHLRLERESREPGEAVWEGHNVCLVSSSPERCFAADVIRAADHRIVLEAPTPDELGEIAEAVTSDQPSGLLDAAVCAALTPTQLRLARRPSQSADDYLRRLAAFADGDVAAQSSPTFTLDALHGMDEAVAWGRDLAADLAAYRAGKLGWSAVDRGVVLVGEPGTGKTTFAQALARTCDVPLIAASYARWQASRQGYLGDLLRAMAETFEEARKAAPCILFMDELDSFHSRGLESRHRDWWTSVINALLEHLDGIEKREGVVVVGATNHLALVDPAIIRSGRLDRTVQIPMPDHPALAGMLRIHLGRDLAEADLTPAALHAAGGTGADCERWVRGARRRARHANRAVTIDDLLAEIGSSGECRSPQLLRIVAVHEAGHALVFALEQPGSLQHVSIAHRDRTHGHIASLLQNVALDERALASMLRHLLAGRAAEHLILGRVTAGSGGTVGSDLARATDLALAAETSLGFAERPLLWQGMWDSDVAGTILLNHPRLAERVNARLEAAWDAVCALLQAHRDVLDAISERLLIRTALSGSEIEGMVAERRCEGAAGHK